jgi:lipopolysaccharide export system protein LptA
MQVFRNIFILFMVFVATDSFAADSPVPAKLKSNAPIEITSDALQVLQQSNKAIFTGHVVAVQGDVRIKSEKMTVFYKGQESTKTDKKSVSPMPEKNSIEKIVVENNVFLSTPEETAKGDNGLYDVMGNKVYLNGNVVLTRDKNVLKGDKLVYDFKTGKSELNAGSAAEGGIGVKPQRVKALFIPDDKGNQEKK